MGKIIVLNGSPRAPKSNSKYYAEIFMRYCDSKNTTYHIITKKNHEKLCAEISGYSNALFVFPLYADSLPVGFLNFLKTLEINPPNRKPIVSILINCGFLEYEQNGIAVQMIKLFCRRNGYKLGSVLMLGSGEAILRTPFKYIAIRSIRQFAHSIVNGNYAQFCVTMPLSKKIFRIAADIYWTIYGKKYGVTRKQMQTMIIEDGIL